jgi:peptidyl-prolyl cis-trans isomerase C
MAAGPQFAMMYDNVQGRRAILDELIAGRLFAISGKEQGLDDTPEFRSALEGFTIQLLARAAVEAALENVTVSDEDSRRFYDENLDNFTIPEQIRASHILIPDDETTDDKIALIQEALENEVSFAALATEHSICPSAGRGGDLDFFGRGQMVSEFEEAAFALEEPGDISEPTRSDFGWHFIRLEERRPASAMPYEDVRPQIEQHLLSEMMAQRYEGALEALRQEHTVEILVD